MMTKQAYRVLVVICAIHSIASTSVTSAQPMDLGRPAKAQHVANMMLQWSSLVAQSSTSASSNLPNIVILYADDMGYGDLGVQNPQSKIPTPHLDRLAREGMRFTDGHSSSGICTPSRYALLTGRHHWRKFHGIVGSFGPSVFDAQKTTLPEMLKQKGYATACIGKWHLGWNWKAIMRTGAKPQPNKRGRRAYAAADFDWEQPIPDGPLDHGFDYYFGDDVPNFPPYTWIENDRVISAPTQELQENPPTSEGNWEARPGPMAADWQLDAVMPRLTEKAVQWIDKQSDSKQPFFLYFPWTSPHAPIVPTKEFQGSTEAGGYGDFMHQSDWSAGQVLDALDRHGLTENTIVIFSSDNGPEHYAYNRVRKTGHRSMGPLRGLKRDIWEGGHRVPFIIRWPKVVEAGSVCEALVSQIDIMATLAAIVDFKLTDDMAEDSHNLLPLVLGEDVSEPIRKAHVHNTKKNHYAIRSGNWLLINAPSGSVTKVPNWFRDSEGYQENELQVSLHKLQEDLGQRQNLAEQHPEKVLELQTLLKQIQDDGFSAPRLANQDAR